MKKLLLLSISVLIGIFAFAQNKTQDHPICERIDNAKGTKTVWAEATTLFTADDIYGNTHDLAAYLAAGKTVILDYSATWCSPCWTMHQSGVLDGLHDAYGPDGTNELVVLWIDVENTNTQDQIEGIAGPDPDGNYYGDYTQGDWTEGGTWPVPIIDNSNIGAGFSELYEGYVPTVFMLCPSGYYKDVTTEAWDGVAAVYAEVGTCPTTGEVPLASIDGSTSGFVGNTLDFSAIVTSVDPVTGYSWTFANGTPATSDVESPSVSWDAVGEYEVTLIATNANGDSQPATITVNIMDGNADDKNVTFEEIIVETTFPNNFAPYNWTTTDEDGGTVWGDFSDQGISGSECAFYAYSHTIGEAALAPYAGDKCGIAMTNNPANGPGVNDDWFISPQFALGTGSTFTIHVAALNDQWGDEEYKLCVSTTDNMPASFTVIGGDRTVGSAWEEVSIDLSAYDGQNIYIGVNYVGTDNYAFMIDNLVLSTIVDVDNEVAASINVFPNPASDIVTVANAENSTITIVNLVGEIVRTIDNASANQTIDMSNLSNGTYFVKVDQEVFKINLSK